MASDIMNNVSVSRKRKLSTELTFESDENDCTQSDTTESTSKCFSSETEFSSQTQTDSSKECDTQDSKTDIDLRCMDMDVVSSPPPSPPEEKYKPMIKILFSDKHLADRLRHQLIHFINSIIDTQFDETVSNDYEINFYGTSTSKASPNLFKIDTTPTPTSMRMREDVPLQYSRNEVVIDERKVESVESKGELRAGVVCFNCDGSHQIRDCAEVKDHRRIAMARNKYMANNPVSAARSVVRYHVDGDNGEQDLKQFAPGKMSSNLKQALNLRRHELPSYIYRMRKLGYPPGWLQEAMAFNNSNSQLELFDFNGSAVSNGKVEVVPQNQDRVIDAKRIVEYPGFNVPMENGCKDDYKYFKSTPYSDTQSKASMLQYIDTVMQRVNEINQEEINANAVSTPTRDLHFSQDVKIPNENIRKNLESRSESPSLNDLEQQKQDLKLKLAELDETATSSSSPVESGVSTAPVIVASNFGTPILKRCSPYSGVPKRDNFMKDITQVIDFENLPDSIGKYEKMSKVLVKVRDVVKKLSGPESQFGKGNDQEKGLS